MNEPITHHLDGSGLACIHLTPRIKHAVNAIAPGNRLQVETDDPAAREGVPAWCRLTGNQMLGTTEHDTDHTTFIIRKKEHT